MPAGRRRPIAIVSCPAPDGRSRTGNPILCNEAPANTDTKWGNTYGFVVMTTAISRNSAVN